MGAVMGAVPKCVANGARTLATAFAFASIASGCAPFSGPAGGAGAPDGPGERERAAASVGEPVRDLPKSRRGNMAEYTVRGQRYRTLDTAAGFRERGVASWYGSKFHGRETSSGEPFDMHALTAAHRHLPLPTFVRVSDVDTGASVIVKVNDRGPFVDDRVIDLSYAAALQLGMLGNGTAEVTVEALSMHAPEGPGEGAVPAPPGGAAGGGRSDAPALVQFGAFADGANADALARRLARRLAPRLESGLDVDYDPARSLYRVRTRLIVDGRVLESTLRNLAAAGIDGYAVLPVATTVAPPPPAPSPALPPVPPAAPR